MSHRGLTAREPPGGQWPASPGVGDGPQPLGGTDGPHTTRVSGPARQRVPPAGAPPGNGGAVRTAGPGCPGSGRTHAVRADGLGAPACRTLRRGQTEPSQPSRTHPTTWPMPGQTTSPTTKGTITAAGGPLPSGNLNEENTREQPATRLTPGRPTGVTSPKRPRHRPARGGAGNSCQGTRSDPRTSHGPEPQRNRTSCFRVESVEEAQETR